MAAMDMSIFSMDFSLNIESEFELELRLSREPKEQTKRKPLRIRKIYANKEVSELVRDIPKLYASNKKDREKAKRLICDYYWNRFKYGGEVHPYVLVMKRHFRRKCICKVKNECTCGKGCSCDILYCGCEGYN